MAHANPFLVRTQRGIVAMDLRRTASLAIAASLFGTVAGAQGTPFLFTTMPTGGGSGIAAHGYYELGYGERTFEPVAGERLEQAIGMRANIGSSLMVLARTGVASFDGAARVSPRAEVLMTRPVGRTVRFAAGLGYAREYSRTDVMPVSYTHLRAHETPEHL